MLAVPMHVLPVQRNGCCIRTFIPSPSLAFCPLHPSCSRVCNQCPCPPHQSGEFPIVNFPVTYQDDRSSSPRSFVEGRPLVDLTDRIERHSAIRASGGAFGDIYQCWCRGITGSSSQVRYPIFAGQYLLHFL